MTDDIFKKTRAGMEYLEFKLKEYEKEITQLKQEVQILREELTIAQKLDSTQR
jgi:hypothetical protein